MNQGLQIWDSAGVNVLDTTSGTVKILGKFGYNPEPVTITHPLLATEDFFSMTYPPYRQVSTAELKTEFNGNTCTIYNTNEYSKRVIYIGVY